MGWNSGGMELCKCKCAIQGVSEFTGLKWWNGWNSGVE